MYEVQNCVAESGSSLKIFTKDKNLSGLEDSMVVLLLNLYFKSITGHVYMSEWGIMKNASEPLYFYPNQHKSYTVRFEHSAMPREITSEELGIHITRSFFYEMQIQLITDDMARESYIFTDLGKRLENHARELGYIQNNFKLP